MPDSPVLLLTTGVLPFVYFICVGLYLKYYPSLLPVDLSALIHITTTALNYVDTKPERYLARSNG